jgi:cytochrome c
MATFVRTGLAALVASAAGIGIAACATAPRFATVDPAEACEVASQGRGGFEGVDLAHGRAVYAADCASCHALSASAARLPGPQLEDVVGRRVGGLPGFRYSRAFEGRSDSWTFDALDRYLEDPEWFVPGTRMNYAGLIDSDDRRDVIAVLACGG